MEEKKDNYICNICNYKTKILYNFNRHCKSIKHIKNNNTTINLCKHCNKEYSNRKSLWSHEKQCKINKEEIIKHAEYILESYVDKKINIILENNEENTKILKEEVKTLNEKIENVKPIVFNLQVFLNEDCKNAISFHDLLQQLQFHFDSSKTLTDDTSNTILKSLTTLTLYERPIHCVDPKRNRLYVKDNDTWTDDKQVFNNLSKYAYNSYKNYVNEWTEDNPDFLQNETKMNAYITFASKEVEDIDTPKIIRNISKITTIPKKRIKK